MTLDVNVLPYPKKRFNMHSCAYLGSLYPIPSNLYLTPIDFILKFKENR